MKNEFYTLPTYPLAFDMWDELARERRPIVVYGMGNGADKLIERLKKYNIKISDFFASDGFVRGHSFHGYKVLSFSEIREKYEDFVIVLSFASNKTDVVKMLWDMNEKYDMYIPDMPIADTEEYFDREFYNANYNKISEALAILSDEKSREIFINTIRYKLTGRMKYLMAKISTRDEMYSYLPVDNIRVSIDAGAYNGDTAREAKHYFKNLKKIYCIEPDTRNFSKLVTYSEAENDISVVPINAAAWRESSVGAFSDSGNRNSTICATPSHEHKTREVSLVSISSLSEEKVDYIKYDVEGAEKEALLGSDDLIHRDGPSLLVSLYHRSRDIFELILYVHERYPDYRLYLSRLPCVPAWELNLIAIR
ncbi:MAG: FkbM family methyltransferase [Clostridia bacterium]|nr:FkbM family methyltransferase [Clostridia bacterium]